MSERPPVQDARVDMMVDQAADPDPDDEAFLTVQEAAGNAKTARKALGLPRTGNPMERTCHRCHRHLSPQTGRVDGRARSERTGICPKCRLDGVGGATFVSLAQPSEISDQTMKRLSSRQRGASPQSTSDVAAFVDDMMPPGTYVARRTSSMSVVLTWDDDTIVTDQERIDLTKRMRNAPTNSRWFVQSFPDFIRLVDQQVGGASDELAKAAELTGATDD